MDGRQHCGPGAWSLGIWLTFPLVQFVLVFFRRGIPNMEEARLVKVDKNA